MEKKLLLSVLLFLGNLIASAEDYTHLTFENSQGIQTSIKLESLTMTISNGKLLAGGQTFTLADLCKMYFDTIDATAIECIKDDDGEGTPVEVFTLNGMALKKYRSIKETKSSLPKGVYVIKTAKRTIKVYVK